MFRIGAFTLKYRRRALPFPSTDAPYAARQDSLYLFRDVNRKPLAAHISTKVPINAVE